MIRQLQPKEDMGRVADEIWLNESIRVHNFIPEAEKFWHIETPRKHKQEGYRGLSEGSLWHSCRQDNINILQAQLEYQRLRG